MPLYTYEHPITSEEIDVIQQRKDKLGYDPIQQKYFKDYSKKRRGLKHPQDKS